MHVLRPSRLSDLAAIERIAAASAVGINSLPPDREKLYDKVRRSTQAFAADADLSGEETYFFVLENAATGEVVGTSGIAASAGFGDRFYSYRNEFVVHASQELGTSSKIHTLQLCHDLAGSSLLTSFYIEPSLEAGIWPQLLSRARLLFIAEHPQRFADRLAAESPGLCDDAGHSPFWDAIGRRFFNLDYPQAEQLAGGRSRSFIADLMPQYPIYVPLLPADARLAIGQLHPIAELPFRLLMDEGFETDTYIDIFDGGPTVDARMQALRSIRKSRRAVARRAGGAIVVGEPHLVANASTEAFRATITELVAGEGGEVRLPASAFEALELADGDELRIVALHPEGD